MNRARKLVAAGIGTAVVLAIVAIMLLSPGLRTQTPAATAPPNNGTPGSGGAGNNTGGGGTGGGTGNGTVPSCSSTPEANESEGPGGSNATVSTYQLLDDTNGTGDQNGSHCGGSTGDHDANGDLHSNDHHGQSLEDMLSQDAIALAPIVSAAATAFWNGVTYVGGLLVQPLASAA